MKVADVMTRDLVAVGPQTPIKDVVSLLLKHQISGIPVVGDDGSFQGLISDTDLVPSDERVPYTGKRAPSLFSDFVPPENPLEPYDRIEQYTARHVLRANAVCVDPDAEITEAIKLLGNDEVRQVPVVRDGKLVGVLTRKDLMRAAIGIDPA